MRVVPRGEANAREGQKGKRGQHGIDKSCPEREGDGSREDVLVFVSTGSWTRSLTHPVICRTIGVDRNEMATSRILVVRYYELMRCFPVLQTPVGKHHNAVARRPASSALDF